jgi:hypothetical protein
MQKTIKILLWIAGILDVIIIITTLFHIQFSTVFLTAGASFFFKASILVICVYFVCTFHTSDKFPKLLSVTVKTLVIVFTLILLLLSSVDGGTLIHSLNIGNGTLSVYRTDGNALTASGLIVKQEQPYIVSFLKRTKVLKNYYPARDIQFKYIEDNKIQVVSRDFDQDQSEDVSPKIGDIWELSSI